MDPRKLEEFKILLLKCKTQIMNSGIIKSSEDLWIANEDLADEADIATTVINQQVSLNIRKRELDKLHAIEDALRRIADGTYGMCEECGEYISDKRLFNQPWTTLCIEHAEELERESARVIAKIG